MPDIFLLETNPEAVKRKARGLALAACLVLVIDVGTCAALLFSLNGWQAPALTPDKLANFHEEALDLALLTLSRLVLLPSLCGLAAYLGHPDRSSSRGGGSGSATAPGAAARRSSSLLSLFRRFSGSRGDLLDGGADGAEGAPSSLRQPLLGARDADVEQPAAAPPPAPADVAASLRDHHQRDQRVQLQRDAVLALVFLVCTAGEVYTGVKCVSFRFAHGRPGAVSAALFASSVAWAAAENILGVKAVETFTIRSGVLRRELHPHELHYASDRSIAGHRCDLCRKRVTEGFRCNVCDFDCCLECFSRRERRGGEGGLRGDKGLRLDADLPPSQYFLRAVRLVRGEWAIFAVAFVCLAATTVATLTLPNYTGSILDQVFKRNRQGFRRDVAFLAAYSVASGAFGGLRSLCFSIVGRRLAFTVRNQLFKAALVQDIAFFDSAATGDLTSRLSYDVANMLQPVNSLLSSTVESMALLCGAIVMCFWQSWQLSLLAVTTLLPATYITQRYAYWSSTLNRHIAAALGEANGSATEALGNVRTVRLLSTERFETDKYESLTRRALACGVRDACGGALAYALNNYLDLFTSVLILWYGGNLALDHQEKGLVDGLTAGRLVTFQLYWGMFNGSYKSLQNVVTSFTRAAGSALRVLSLVDSAPDIGAGGAAPPPGAQLSGRLDFDDVSFHYQMRPDIPVLQGVTLHIPASSTCALVGRSGGGKSTLCHLALRFYDPTRGAVRFDGVDLRELNLEWVHRHMGVVAQDTQLFADTVAYNIGYGCPVPFTEEDLHNAARAAHAHAFIQDFPDGYATRVGERGVRLSGGQRQRIAIARAFLRRPKILLLDEATSALDAESEGLVQAALDSLIAEGGRTVLLVAHRLSTVVGADQIAVVDGGRVAERGPHAELVARPGGVYARLVARQLARQANVIGGGEGGAAEAAAAGGGGGGGAAAAQAAQADVVDGLLDDAPPPAAAAGAGPSSSSSSGGAAGSSGRTAPQAPPAPAASSPARPGGGSAAAACAEPAQLHVAAAVDGPTTGADGRGDDASGGKGETAGEDDGDDEAAAASGAGAGAAAQQEEARNSSKWNWKKGGRR